MGWLPKPIRRVRPAKPLSRPTNITKIRQLVSDAIQRHGLIEGATPKKSGRFVVRLPQSLHAALEREAASERVSLNQLVLTKLAVGLGRLQVWRERRHERIRPRTRWGRNSSRADRGSLPRQGVHKRHAERQGVTNGREGIELRYAPARGPRYHRDRRTLSLATQASLRPDRRWTIKASATDHHQRALGIREVPCLHAHLDDLAFCR